PYYSLLTSLNPPPSTPSQALHPTYIPPHIVDLSPPPRAAASSPISTQVEDADILARFFRWKLRMTKNNEQRQKWESAQSLVIEHDWTIAELKQMEDGIGVMYQKAIKAGISDGFARRFRAELHIYIRV